jgi:hypothetical protein
MIPNFLPLFLFVAAALWQSQIAKEVAEQPYDVDEAYAVYSAVVPDQWTVQVGHAKSLVFNRETVFSRTCLTPEEESTVSQAPAIADYYRANRKQWTLLPKFEVEILYTLVPQEKLSAFFKSAGPNGWADFDKAYPDSAGWIEFSAVGFSRDMTFAVLYVAHYCGSRCGGGGVRALQKKDGKWQPAGLGVSRPCGGWIS